MRVKMTSVGSALIPIILIIALFSMFSLTLLQESSLLSSDIKKLRIRSMITIIESSVRAAVQQPFAYVNCNSSIGPSSCNVNWEYIQKIGTNFTAATPSKNNALVFRYALPQARCPVSLPSCGLLLKNASLDFVSGEPKFKAIIEYEGVDLSIRPIVMEITIPKNLLQEDEFTCSSGLFSGFDSGGKIICRQPVACSGWSYAKDINESSLDAICAPLPSGTFGNSPRILEGLSWTDSGVVVKTKWKMLISWWAGK